MTQGTVLGGIGTLTQNTVRGTGNLLSDGITGTTGTIGDAIGGLMPGSGMLKWIAIGGMVIVALMVI